MKLDAYLKKEKLSANAFAAKIGVATIAVSRYLVGRVPNPEIMVAIHRATKGEVQPNDFYSIN